MEGVDPQDGQGGAISGGARTLGDAFHTFHTGNINHLLSLIMGLTFVIGIAITWRGLTKLKDAADTNGTQVRYTEGIYRIAAGAFLVSIVSTLFMGWATIGAAPYGHGKGVWETNRWVAKPGQTVSMESGDFIAMMGNFAIDAAGPLSTLVLAISVIIGIVLVASSLLAFSKLDSNGGRDSFASVAMRFWVGVLLTNAYWTISIISASFGFDNPFSWVGDTNFSKLGEAAKESILNYNPAEEGGLVKQAQAVMSIAFMSLVPFGLISFVRGLLIMKDTVEANKQASLGAACVYMLAGVALVNSKKFSCVVSATFMGTPPAWCV